MTRSTITPTGTINGIDWAVRETQSRRRTWCVGYVRLPEGHPWRATKPYELDQLRVPFLPFEVSYLDENGWLGWDSYGRRPVSLEEAEHLTRQLAEHLSGVGAAAV